jgi:hypothetical protein
LPNFAVFGAVDEEGRVGAGAELGAVGVVYGEGDGLAAKPLEAVLVGTLMGNWEARKEIGMEGKLKGGLR